MTIDSFIRRLDRSFSWLYYKHQWAEWELLAIAIIAMVLLLWILRRQKNAATRNAYADRAASKRSPIIGIKLADYHQSRHAIEDIKEHRLDLIAQFSGRQKRKIVARHMQSLNEQLRQLQDAIARYKDMEEGFVQKVTELTAANEKLQNEIGKNAHDEQHPRQQTAESAFADDKQQEKTVEHPIEQMIESTPAHSEREQDAAQPKPTVTLLKLKVTELPSVDEQPGHIKQRGQIEEYAEQAVGLSPAGGETHALEGGHEQDGELAGQQGPESNETDKRLHRMVAEEHQDDETPEEGAKQPRPLRRESEPLDVQKLKAIAALARQIQGYPPQG
ncbi:MAG: hypothetical protein ABIF19_16695 [Planctomycetota bacterium]